MLDPPFKNDMPKLTLTRIRRATPLVIGGILLALGYGCRREQERDRAEQQFESKQQAAQLVFPDRLRVEDGSVNEFVQRVIEDCAGGEYDTFRLLWSARDEPLRRDEYEEGWHAIQRIEVLVLEKLLLAPGSGRESQERELAYAVALQVALDPAHRAAKREPERDVILLLIREHDEWRISRAPRRVRTWIRERLGRPDPVTPPAPKRPSDEPGPD